MSMTSNVRVSVSSAAQRLIDNTGPLKPFIEKIITDSIQVLVNNGSDTGMFCTLTPFVAPGYPKLSLDYVASRKVCYIRMEAELK